MSEPLLRLDALEKDWGDGRGLSPTSFSADRGELIVLSGHNGAGKSTLIDLCVGLLEPTRGQVLIDGMSPTSIEARRLTAHLPDTPVLYDDLSLREHLIYIGGLHGEAVDDNEVDGILDGVDLLDRGDDRPMTFSRGMKQRSALACVLIRRFDLLFVDEPFVGLDREGQELAVEVMADAVANGATVLASTHHDDLEAHATRTIMLVDGVVTEDTGS